MDCKALPKPVGKEEMNMEWTQIVLYTAVALLALVLVCWIVNLVLVSRKKEPNIWISRLMYLAAIIAVILNAVRSAVVYTGKSMLAANLIVLVCVAVSLVRMERIRKYGEPPEEDEENT